MKQVFSFVFLLLGIWAAAQAPQGLHYQGVARNAAGNPLANQPVQVRLSLRDGTANGTVVYSEERSVTTNAFGLFTLLIGGPGAVNVQGNFSTVNWGAGAKFLQTEIKVGAQASFSDLGTTQLMSVPYSISSLQTRQLQFPFDTTVNSNNGAAFALKNTSTAAFAAIQAESVNGAAISGSSTNNSGVAGYSAKLGGSGVSGFTSVNGGYGVFGNTVAAHANSVGVYGQSSSGQGVRGQTSNGVGVLGRAVGTGHGVQGFAEGSGYGVAGRNDEGTGVYGRTSSGIGVLAHAYQDGTAIYGSALGNGRVFEASQNDSGIAIKATANKGFGILVHSSNNDGVSASSSSTTHAAGRFSNGLGYALVADGKVRLSGSGMNAGAGKVLTSDAMGNASWQAPAAAPKIAFRLFGALNHGVNNYAPETGYKVYFANEAYDYGNSISVGSNAANSLFTAPVSGIYHFDASVLMNSSTGGIDQAISLIKVDVNGGTHLVAHHRYSETATVPAAGLGGRPNTHVSGDINLAAGEKVYVQVYWRNGHESGSTQTGVSSIGLLDSPGVTTFSGHLVFPL